MLARYSTADQTLAVRAQLTANSWLFTKDCRLTGGFAFMVWFDRPQGIFVLFLGIMRLLGEETEAIRLGAALYNAASVPLLYALVRRVAGGRADFVSRHRVVL